MNIFVYIYISFAVLMFIFYLFFLTNKIIFLTWKELPAQQATSMVVDGMIKYLNPKTYNIHINSDIKSSSQCFHDIKVSQNLYISIYKPIKLHKMPLRWWQVWEDDELHVWRLFVLSSFILKVIHQYMESRSCLILIHQ